MPGTGLGAAAPVAVVTFGQQQLGQKPPVGQQLTNQKESEHELHTAAHGLIGEGEMHLEVDIIPVSDQFPKSPAQMIGLACTTEPVVSDGSGCVLRFT
jgi:hypothetical protein